MRTHEYAEAVTEEAVARAARRVRQEVRGNNRDLLHARAAAAARAYFCPCVTDAEDAAEGHVSSIHAALIAEVVRRVEEGR